MKMKMNKAQATIKAQLALLSIVEDARLPIVAGKTVSIRVIVIVRDT